MRYFPLLAALLLALPVAAQEPDDYRGVVVAEIEDEAIRPLLAAPQVAGLVGPEFDEVTEREGRRPQFEQSRVVRGPVFRLEVDAQFADGDDFLVSLPLHEVEYGEKRLLVLVRRNG